MEKEISDLVLYLNDFKEDYLKPIHNQYLRRETLPEDKRKAITDKYFFLRGFVENIEQVIEIKTIQ